MPFNEAYQQVMNKIAETGTTAAAEYAARNSEAGKENAGGQSSIDWGNLVNSFANAAQSYADNRQQGRAWNDFKVDATIDESTQKTIIFVVIVLAAALVYYGIKTAKK